MKRYLVKNISVGSEYNPIYAGEVHEWIYVKGGYTYVLDGLPLSYLASEYGWSRKHWAEKFIEDTINSENIYEKRNWINSYEILEFDV